MGGIVGGAPMEEALGAERSGGQGLDCHHIHPAGEVLSVHHPD